MNNCKIIEKGYSITISKPATLIGKAPFSGKKVKMTLFPSEERGIWFYYKSSRLCAEPLNISLNSKLHTTTLASRELEIKSVEHFLSSLYGFGVDSLIVKLEGDNQIPVIDSSAFKFSQVLKTCGQKATKNYRKLLKIDKKFKFQFAHDDSFAILSPSLNLTLEMEIMFDNIIGNQKFKLDVDAKSYYKEIAWARTFIRSPLNYGDTAKWERIRKVLPILPENPQESPVIIFSDTGFITELNSPDEPIRHKILDALGDLSILGMRIEGSLFLFKPGHFFNQQLVQFLSKQVTR